VLLPTAHWPISNALQWTCRDCAPNEVFQRNDAADAEAICDAVTRANTGSRSCSPHLKRRSDEAQAATLEFGKVNAKRWLALLNDYWIGPDKTYLVGNTITIADYFGAGIVTLGEIIGVDFAPYPNVTRWLAAMTKLPNWGKVNEAFDGLREAVKGQQFVTLV
jgi:glutathione S-transferase